MYTVVLIYNAPRPKTADDPIDLIFGLQYA